MSRLAFDIDLRDIDAQGQIFPRRQLRSRRDPQRRRTPRRTAPTMSRPLRIEWPGALYHVTARGHLREPIVEDDVDRERWVALLEETAARFDLQVHAWCLMTNHHHLLLETPQANRSQGMRHLNGVWSQRFNRRHGRVGHVFQGRFKAIFVERQSYLLELARYIVLNPVRAGIVALPEQWPWSSCHDTLAPVGGHCAQRALPERWAPVAVLGAPFAGRDPLCRLRARRHRPAQRVGRVDGPDLPRLGCLCGPGAVAHG
jgi:REP element-mobilizing transposase RayT